MRPPSGETEHPLDMKIGEPIGEIEGLSYENWEFLRVNEPFNNKQRLRIQRTIDGSICFCAKHLSLAVTKMILDWISWGVYYLVSGFNGAYYDPLWKLRSTNQ